MSAAFDDERMHGMHRTQEIAISPLEENLVCNDNGNMRIWPAR